MLVVVLKGVIARTRSRWKEFRDLLTVLTSRGLFLLSKGRVCQACACCIVLTLVNKRGRLIEVRVNNMRMIRWVCNVTLKPSSKL